MEIECLAKFVSLKEKNVDPKLWKYLTGETVTKIDLYVVDIGGGGGGYGTSKVNSQEEAIDKLTSKVTSQEEAIEKLISKVRSQEEVIEKLISKVSFQVEDIVFQGKFSR